MTYLSRLADSFARQSTPGKPILLAALALAGCATGSSSSFTQAPLLFAESADASGKIVASTDGPRGDPDLAPYLRFGDAIPNYAAVGGNAVLPINALLPADLVSVETPAISGIAASVATPVASAQVALSPGAARPVDAAAIIGAPPRAAALAGAAAATASQALVTAKPILAGRPLKVPGQAANLLAASSATLRACLAKGC